ncbi:MAG: hypothetical protein GTO45_12320 [Candidatus Aminicenantes bacterium]|nr:hypothetical protein [Candidatus Aminicenantes bacterium]NIM79588.1 hypothetical protein [Candidatus Aminicenantes bacterium]NIN18897.1 hypothetical protein [Candidatus Aminicenantes bacterium]NIN42807.1 hypothetical protein [Candidatus Aminicenantes bacterium]NIN85534.1 hypothetical protein [Candidatus Aminicenantes bacterium]
MKREQLISIFVVIISGCMTMSFAAEESNTWIVERDMPQTRNLIPVLNRTTLIASGPGVPAECTVIRHVKELNIKKGPFWPAYGKYARMSAPVLVPEDFPCREPRVLDAPQITGRGEDVQLKWSNIKLMDGEGVVIHTDTWLGPPDMYHTDKGLNFGDIAVDTNYTARLAQETGTDGHAVSVLFTCKITVTNRHSEPAESVEFSFLFPRALMDNKTGQEIPLLEEFTYTAKGFSDPEPLDLLVCDGLARPAWGPRCLVTRKHLGPGERFTCLLTVKGKITGGEVLIVPLVSLMGRIPARYWQSSEIEITPPGKLHYSDYTHFNLVVADSRLFRVSTHKVSVEPSSPVVLQFLGTGFSK